MAKVFTITSGLENMGALRTGGQGSVYKGRRIGPIITAVKLLPTPIHTEDEDDKNFKDFQNEVEKLKKVNEEPNPNVVKILNYGLTESGSFPFIEMEYIEGPDLEELLKEPHDPVFAIREVIKLADQLANALAHCHKVGVKHGDIKSNNVKFNLDTGNYMLLDFGLAVMSDEQRRSSLRHAGAIEFMAPEQHEGEMLFQTDVYSYGIILYELLAGTVPFPLANKGETARNTVMVAHMEAPLPDLMDLRWHHLPASWDDDKKEQEMLVPKWLLDIIEKCLQKKPEDRYSNGIELREAILENSSLGMHSKEEVEETIGILQSENERLRSLIMQHQETIAALQQAQPEEGMERPVPVAQAGSGISLSKPVFWILALLMGTLTVYSAANLFKKNKTPEVIPSSITPTDPANNTEADKKPVEKKKTIIPAAVRSVKKPAVKPPATKPASTTTTTTTAAKTPVKPKPVNAKKKLADSLQAIIRQTIQHDSVALHKKGKINKTKKPKKNLGSDVPYF